MAGVDRDVSVWLARRVAAGDVDLVPVQQVLARGLGRPVHVAPGLVYVDSIGGADGFLWAEDAAEAAQEAFFAAWQGLKSFRGDSSFSTWLYRLASNACVDLLRREGKRQADASLDDEDLNLDIPASIPSPQEEAERRELREQIEEGLRALPPEYRAALVLREIQQLRYDEIGKALELDIGTVKSRIARARLALRDFLIKSGNFSAPPPSK